jgi:hypothetical protein
MTLAEREREYEESARRFAKVPMPDVDVVVERIRQLAVQEPLYFKAIGLLIQGRPTNEALHVQSKRGRRSDLLTRLQTIHTCPRKDDPGFVQLQPPASGDKSWRCSGCGAVISVEKGSR